MDKAQFTVKRVRDLENCCLISDLVVVCVGRLMNCSTVFAHPGLDFCSVLSHRLCVCAQLYKDCLRLADYIGTQASFYLILAGSNVEI